MGNISSKLIRNLFLSSSSTEETTTLYSQVFIDSRVHTNNGLFVPIVGERFDGHDFIKSAIDNGAVGALWGKEHKVPNDLPASFQLYFVDDTLTALQQLAKAYVKEVNPVVIGITGSNGKTSTKDIVESVLATKYSTHKTKGNYNNHIGLPLTILSMGQQCEVLILEMGMNHFGEISLLSKIAEPDYAIVTNIGESHIEHLGSREGIAKAKMEIVDGLKEGGKVYLDGDEPLLHSYHTNYAVCCGYEATNDVVITSYSGDENGFEFQLNNKTSYNLPLLGKHNVKNASYVIALAEELKLDEKLIKKGLSKVQLTNMRLERRKGYNDSLLINDAYNASPTSMVAAIESIKELHDYSKRILVLGDMYELGQDEEKLHRSIAKVIHEPITHLITVGDKGNWIGDELQKQTVNTMVVHSIITKEEVSKYIKPLLNSTTVVLFKASRGVKLETVVDELTQ
ncbi:UDP-N-acetylmuramoyl-tripeptide--D-alanyl-D-alanine ligase [Bacillus sp. FJAT-45350]|uniref:UDP-N-acetylmuramoyl-tripeptide--D-alanyl-D- alanine ligase n=1 Tax=Bacillus sp. FJAT-45350 TaxID=2011014 RepID=UPI000BB83A15|nr:UDP-N-acetylmuramoyl-tripeptide--D-alanyl-D-alanine ligase [Bacillus sp. FJAT-45350]